MVDVQTPASVGVVSAATYAAAMVVPYVAGGVPGGAVETYYTEFGIVGPPYVAVLALVCLVVLGAGRAGRTAPDVAAGVALVLGFVVTLLTATWAFGGVGELVGSLSTAAWLAYHRWVLLAAALGLLGSSLWFADAIGVLRVRPEPAS
ncbi:hypothetical protein G9C85_00080 [Halorubellus sp. JP-L1]|uniref:DUF7548 family protein n=1 Tax=Halorubellus sp. JP-L1 TaxID=2715753 RepID=UPI00140B1D6E|nr:hypothetical protein [Halorubellus sp. JP-L1]NHN40036.1 hypothetical protein [Halorubellus sp. JP-L1]